MAKRGAVVQLTDRNWENEDEKEEAGHFKQADSDQLNKRVIKKAKRRVVAGSEIATSAFKGFQGFGAPQPTSTSSPLPTSTAFSGFKGFGPFGASTTSVAAAVKPETKKNEELESQYMKQVKTLNQSVCEWIKKHITQNPYVDLSPVFKDYEKHLADIDKKFSPNDTTMKLDTQSKELTVPSGPPGKFESTGLSWPSTSSAVTSTSGLNGAVTFPSVKSSTISTSSNTGEAEPDDTPKTGSQVHSSPEKGAFFSTRCKLFFKRGESWSELGVGMLSLKKVDNKTQVTVRNDTALGKITLNIFLNEDTPITRSGKNNVLVISVPNPPVFTKGNDGDNSQPVSYLIRVKTSQNADDLYKNMSDTSS